MNKNIGTKDRLIRLIIALLLLYFSITQKSTGLALMGAFTLYESLAGWCIVYQFLGLNTCSLKQRKSINFIGNYATGISVLFVAILLNITAQLVGLKTWYEFILNTNHILTIDNYIFLFLVYPLALGFTAHFIETICDRKELKIKKF